MFYLAANCYIADITDATNRTKRMSFLYGLYPVGSNIGKALSGVIKGNLGLMYNFTIGLGVTSISLLYMFFFVKDSKDIVRKKLIAQGEKPGER